MHKQLSCQHFDNTGQYFVTVNIVISLFPCQNNLLTPQKILKHFHLHELSCLMLGWDWMSILKYTGSINVLQFTDAEVLPLALAQFCMLWRIIFCKIIYLKFKIYSLAHKKRIVNTDNTQVENCSKVSYCLI